jgi:hypothetical protein
MRRPVRTAGKAAGFIRVRCPSRPLRDRPHALAAATVTYSAGRTEGTVQLRGGGTVHLTGSVTSAARP